MSDNENYTAPREVLIIDSRVVGKWWQHMKPSPFDHLKTIGERMREQEQPAAEPVTVDVSARSEG